MGATLFREHKVFKMDLGIDDGSMFGGETVIVASLHCEKNCRPHTYKWSLEYIGGVDTFVSRYLPETAYFFDDGLSQCGYAPTGAAFKRHLKRLYNSAGLLTVDDLHSMGFHGYSWPEEQISKISDRSNLMKFSDWLGTRYAGKLDTDADVEKLIREAYEMVPSNVKNIWMFLLWRLDHTQVKKLQPDLEINDSATYGHPHLSTSS